MEKKEIEIIYKPKSSVLTHLLFSAKGIGESFTEKWSEKICRNLPSEIIHDMGNSKRFLKEGTTICKAACVKVVKRSGGVEMHDLELDHGALCI